MDLCYTLRLKLNLLCIGENLMLDIVFLFSFLWFLTSYDKFVRSFCTIIVYDHVLRSFRTIIWYDLLVRSFRAIISTEHFVRLFCTLILYDYFVKSFCTIISYDHFEPFLIPPSQGFEHSSHSDNSPYLFLCP